MAQILIRQLDDDAKERLKERAERNGRSLEAEAREILKAAAEHERTRRRSTPGFGTRIAGQFKGNRSHEIGAGKVQSDDRQSAQRARAFRQV